MPIPISKQFTVAFRSITRLVSTAFPFRWISWISWMPCNRLVSWIFHSTICLHMSPMSSCTRTHIRVPCDRSVPWGFHCLKYVTIFVLSIDPRLHHIGPYAPYAVVCDNACPCPYPSPIPCPCPNARPNTCPCPCPSPAALPVTLVSVAPLYHNVGVDMRPSSLPDEPIDCESYLPLIGRILYLIDIVIESFTWTFSCVLVLVIEKWHRVLGLMIIGSQWNSFLWHFCANLLDLFQGIHTVPLHEPSLLSCL